MIESTHYGKQRDPLNAAGRNPSRTLVTFNPLEKGSSGAEDPFRAIAELRQQLAESEKENSLLKSSNEFGIALANITDRNLAIHQAILRLQYSLKSGLAAYFNHNRDNQRLELFFPFGPEISRLREKLGERWEHYWHSLTGGLIGKAIRYGKVQSCNEPDPTLELLHSGSRPFLSLLAAPVLARGNLEGVILLADTRQNYFDSMDIRFAGDICNHFSAALERISFAGHEDLIVQATTRMVEIRDSRAILHQLAELTLETTGARMAIAAVYDETDWWIEAAGQVDQQLIKDHPGLGVFFRFVSTQPGPFPLQDYRNHDLALRMDIQDPALRPLLACPFKLSDYVSAQEGVLLALGKTSGLYFNAVDETLIQHLANNAALALDYSMTKKDLRAIAERNQIALNLSLDIARTNQLNEAAHRFLLDVKNQVGADIGGLVLVDETDQIIVQVSSPDHELEDSDIVRVEHPTGQILESIHRGEQIVHPSGDTIKKIFPIKTQERCYGALWLELPIRSTRKLHRDEDVRALINQTAVALESSIRNSQIQTAYTAVTESHARLEKSHNQLSETFKQTIISLMSALEAREKETAEHNKRMEKTATLIGIKKGLDRGNLEDLCYGALMHDIGKIGVSDNILLKSDSLTAEERKLIEEHPLIGAALVQNIPGLEGAAQIIANHHELWNGSGYPKGLSGRMIPLLARIVTVADVFDALTHDRPYRKGYTVYEAREIITKQSGILYDPELVEILFEVVPILEET